jgi:hypothetical protein
MTAFLGKNSCLTWVYDSLSSTYSHMFALPLAHSPRLQAILGKYKLTPVAI